MPPCESSGRFGVKSTLSANSDQLENAVRTLKTKKNEGGGGGGKRREAAAWWEMRDGGNLKAERVARDEGGEGRVGNGGGGGAVGG